MEDQPNKETNEEGHNRFDEPWTLELVELAKNWSVQCQQSSKKHKMAGYITQKSHNRYGLITVIVLIVMGMITTIIGIFDSKSVWINVVSSVGFTMGAISSAVYKWLNLGEITQLHWQYTALYESLAIEINYEITRKPKFRKPADTFMENVVGKIHRYKANAPTIPKGWSCCGCSSDIDDLIEDYKENEHEERV